MSVPPNQMPAPQPEAAPPQAGPPAPEAPPQGGGGTAQQTALENFRQFPPEVQVVVKECVELINENGEEMVGQVMQADTTIAIALSQVAMSLISGVALRLEQEATEETGEQADVRLDLFVGDAGPGEIVLATLFGVAEQMGIQEATDENEYIAAGDALDMMLETAAMGGPGEEGDAPPEEAAAPAAAPPGGQDPNSWRSPA